jgi:8-oxo-dGTP pyrophosphatase MutT (NUDIX family)
VTEYARRTARVLLLDRDERVLLFHYDTDHGPFWLAPGGGVDAGEGIREAAARELAEEVGLSVPADDLGPHVAFAAGYAALGWIDGILRDDYFLHRVDGHDVDVAGMMAYERENLLGHRWWSAAELAGSDEDIVPRGLAELLAALPDDGAQPVELPWHH